MLRCPHCQSTRLRVIGSEHIEDTDFFRRHRKCKACLKNFHTREYVEDSTLRPLDQADIKVALSFLYRAASTLTKGRYKRKAFEGDPRSRISSRPPQNGD